MIVRSERPRQFRFGANDGGRRRSAAAARRRRRCGSVLMSEARLARALARGLSLAPRSRQSPPRRLLKPRCRHVPHGRRQRRQVLSSRNARSYPASGDAARRRPCRGWRRPAAWPSRPNAGSRLAPFVGAAMPAFPTNLVNAAQNASENKDMHSPNCWRVLYGVFKICLRERAGQRPVTALYYHDKFGFVNQICRPGLGLFCSSRSTAVGFSRARERGTKRVNE
jgi:hypothetical protein